MLLNARLARRAVVGVIGTGAAAGAILFGTAPSALADPPPNCTAADLAGVSAGVSASTSAYLFTHPDVNAFFTSKVRRVTRSGPRCSSTSTTTPR
jgi:hypothetical protein